MFVPSSVLMVWAGLSKLMPSSDWSDSSSYLQRRARGEYDIIFYAINHTLDLISRVLFLQIIRAVILSLALARSRTLSTPIPPGSWFRIAHLFMAHERAVA